MIRKKKKNNGIYRSGFEQSVTNMLRANNVPHEYETVKLSYTKPATNHIYTPDVLLPNGIIVELKGYLDADTKKKMELVIKQHSHLDIRFCFMNPNAKIRKGSKTSYSDWCNKKGFKWGTPAMIVDWAKEPKRK